MANGSLSWNSSCREPQEEYKFAKEHHEQELAVALPPAILSLVLGVLAASSNGLLLLTLYKDPLKCFKGRSVTVFIFFLALSDFLGAVIVQFLHSLYMFCRLADIELILVYNITFIGSHLGTKISVFTVVGMSIDRYLAVKLAWKYKLLVKAKRVIFFNICVWIFVICFEASHSTGETAELMHTVDLHLQTTFPLTLLAVIYLATYLEFRRYTRNAVFAQKTGSTSSKPYRRNIKAEKKIVNVVLVIMVVLFVSLLPYLVTKHYEEHCHEEHDDQEKHERQKCHEESGFAIAKNIATSLLCVSSVFNPFLYALRISNYSRAFKVVFKGLYRGNAAQLDTPEASLTFDPPVMPHSSVVTRPAQARQPHVIQVA